MEGFVGQGERLGLSSKNNGKEALKSFCVEYM